MALRTASVSGKWSSTATWGGNPVPVSGDTVACNVGVTVEFDVDQSGFAAGIGTSTWNGILQLTTTPGNYYLKMNGSLTFGASAQYLINGGSIGTPVAAGVTFELHQNAAANIVFNATTVVDVVCQDSPVAKYIKLSQAENAGATTLHVNTDVSGDTNYWKNGAIIHICNINASGTVDIEKRTISSVTSSTIVISAGLTNAKLSGSYVILISRNVKHTGNGTGAGGIIGQVSGNWISEVRDFSACLSPSANATSSLYIGGTLADSVTGVQTVRNATIAAIISNMTTTGISAPGNLCTGSIFGCTTGNSLPSAFAHVGGVIAGCPTAMNQPRGGLDLIGVTVDGCQVGISGGGGIRLLNCTFQNNPTDVSGVIDFDSDNTLFGGTTEFANYNSLATRHVQPWVYCESLNHDQVAGAFRSWVMGGITSSVASPVYDSSRPRSYNAVCESATYPCFFQRRVLVPAGGTLSIVCYARKDTAMSYVPRVWAFEDWKEPLASGSPDLEILMADNQDTWQVLEGKLTNTSDSAKYYLVRMLAKNASGNCYFDPILRVSSFQMNPDLVGGMVA